MQVSDRFPIEELGLSRGLWRGEAHPSRVQQERRTPGRAPAHGHSYDEIVYIIDGEGITSAGRRR